MSPRAADESALEVDHLVVRAVRSGAPVIGDVSLRVDAGEVLGLVGESGSGKTTLSLAMLGYVRRGLRIAGGRVLVGGRSLLELDAAGLRAVRGSLVAYVPQDPASALNPALRVGAQLRESYDATSGEAPAEAVAAALESVNLAGGASVLRRYPHELSGGQQQRVAIAMAILNRPRLLIMDEPTTGLDVTTQARVLETVRVVCRAYGGGVVYVSHDLAVVTAVADRLAVLYAGRLAEVGPTEAVASRPMHPYTQGLLAAVPDVRGERALRGIAGRAPERATAASGCVFAPRCDRADERCTATAPPPIEGVDRHSAWCFNARVVGPAPIVVRSSAARPPVRDPLLSVLDLRACHSGQEVLHGVTLEVGARASVALVGRSGSGKTTLARCIAGLGPSFTGTISFSGQELSARARRRPASARARVQYVFQNPYGSLNPRRTIGDIVAQPLMVGDDRPGAAAIEARVTAALDDVALARSTLGRRPYELSGGQRQRVAIARALVARPTLLICDEITSSLDVSVQAVIVQLLMRLKDEHDLSLLFVTHNLALVPHVADEIVVLEDGRIVERGSTRAILDAPRAPETRDLVRHLPRLTSPDSSEAADPTQMTTTSARR